MAVSGEVLSGEPTAILCVGEDVLNMLTALTGSVVTTSIFGLANKKFNLKK